MQDSTPDDVPDNRSNWQSNRTGSSDLPPDTVSTLRLAVETSCGPDGRDQINDERKRNTDRSQRLVLEAMRARLRALGDSATRAELRGMAESLISMSCFPKCMSLGRKLMGICRRRRNQTRPSCKDTPLTLSKGALPRN